MGKQQKKQQPGGQAGGAGASTEAQKSALVALNGAAAPPPDPAAPPPDPAAAAADAKVTNDARGYFVSYRKGKRRKANLEKLQELHAKSPNAATCLLLAKLQMLEAVEACHREDDAKARETAALAQLNAALKAAMQGVQQFRSPTCLAAAVWLHRICAGKPGTEWRLDAYTELRNLLDPRNKEVAQQIEWADAAAEVLPNDRWGVDIGPNGSQADFIKQVAKHFKQHAERIFMANLTGSGTKVIDSSTGRVLDMSKLDAADEFFMAVSVELLPESLVGELHKRLRSLRQRKEQPAAAEAGQGRERGARRGAEAAQEEEGGSGGGQHSQRGRELLLKRKQEELASRRARADKVRDHLLARLAAAAAEGSPAAAEGSPEAAEGSPAAAGGSGSVSASGPAVGLPEPPLEGLLAQTGLTEAQLRSLLTSVGASKEEQAAVLTGVLRAKDGQACAYELPQQARKALEAGLGRALPPEALHGRGQQPGGGGGSGAGLLSELRELVWNEPDFAHQPGLVQRALGVSELCEKFQPVQEAVLCVPKKMPSGSLSEGEPWQLPDPEQFVAAVRCEDDLDVVRFAVQGHNQSAPMTAMILAMQPLDVGKPRRAGAGAPPLPFAEGGRISLGGARMGVLGRMAGVAGLDEWQADAETVDDEVGTSAAAHLALAAGGSRAAEADSESADSEEREKAVLPLQALDVLYQQQDFASRATESLLDEDSGASWVNLHYLATGQEPHVSRKLHALACVIQGAELLELLAARRYQEADPAVPDAGSRADLARLEQCWADVDPVPVVEALLGEEDAGMRLLVLEACRELRDGKLPALIAGGALISARLLPKLQMVGRMLTQADQWGQRMQRIRTLLCRRILAGLHALQEGQRLTRGICRGVNSFILISLHGPLQAGAVIGDAVGLLGQLPFCRLLQLLAFVALHVRASFASPADAMPRLQEQLVAIPGDVTAEGGVQLSVAGVSMAVLEQEALQALSSSLAGNESAEISVQTPSRLGVLHAGNVCLYGRLPAVVDRLATYCSGLTRAEAEAMLVAHNKGEEVVDVVLQRGGRVQRYVQHLRTLAAFHSTLAGVHNLGQSAARDAEVALRLVEEVVELTQEAMRSNSFDDASTRAELGDKLYSLGKKLQRNLEHLEEAVDAAQEAHVVLSMAYFRRQHEQLDMRAKALKAQLEVARAAAIAGAEGGGVAAVADLETQHTRTVQFAKAMLQKVQEVEITERGPQGILKELGRDDLDMRELNGVIITFARALEGPPTGESLAHHPEVLVSKLQSVTKNVTGRMDQLVEALHNVDLLAEAARVHGERLLGDLLYGHCLRPTLLPAYRAMTRNLLMAKWEGEVAAEREAAQEAEAAKAEAAARALLEEEEEWHDASSTLPGKAKRKKKKGKKGGGGKQADAQAEGEVEAGPQEASLAAAQQQGTPPREETAREQEERAAGFRRMMEQMAAAEAEEAARAEAEAARAVAEVARAEEERRAAEEHAAAQQRARREAEEAAARQHAEQAKRPARQQAQRGEEPAQQAARKEGPPSPRMPAAAAGGPPSFAGQQQPGPAKQPEQQPPRRAEAQAGASPAASPETSPRQQKGSLAAPPGFKPPAQGPAGSGAAQGGAAPAKGRQGSPDVPPPSAKQAAQEQQRPEQQRQGPQEPGPGRSEGQEAAEDDSGWQQAPTSHRRGKGGKSGGSAAAQSVPRQTVIFSWEGHWLCGGCGNRVPPRVNCGDCGELNPCRQYVFEGGCRRGGPPVCMFPHPPFDLPSDRPPPQPQPPPGSRQAGMKIGLVSPPPGVPLQGGLPPPFVSRPDGDRGERRGGPLSRAVPAGSQGPAAGPAAAAAAGPAAKTRVAVRAVPPEAAGRAGGRAGTGGAWGGLAAAEGGGRSGSGGSWSGLAAGSPRPQSPAPPLPTQPPSARSNASAGGAWKKAAAAGPPGHAAQLQQQPPAAPLTPPLEAAGASAPAGPAPAPAEEEEDLADLLGMMGLSGDMDASGTAGTAGAAGTAGTAGLQPLSPSEAAWGQPPPLAAGPGRAAPGAPPGGSWAGLAAKQQQQPEGAVPGAPGSWAQRAWAATGSSHEEGFEEAEAGADSGLQAWPAPGQSQEDAELEAAIAASLADAEADAHAVSQLSRLAAASSAAAAGGGCEAAADGLALPGLRNEAGEYNCFLNVIIQCLWRCTEFRQQVAAWDAQFCARDPVLAAMHGLFAQLLQQQQQQQGGQAAGAGGQGAATQPLDPTALREALAELPGQHFRMGEMNDAAEVLLSIYDRVMETAAQLQRPSGIDATFGLSVKEQVDCPSCHKSTQHNSYTQYFYNTHATMLHMLCCAADGLSLGGLLRAAEAQHQKSCDTDMGGCGRSTAVNHFLERAPRVFTLQLTWSSNRAEPEEIAGVTAAVDEEVDLGEVYQGVERGLHRYRLRSMVCYYGQHYQALVLVPDAGGWLMFDDTRVTRVGAWADVKRKCEAGRVQPSVLFFEAVGGGGGTLL